MLGEVRIKMSLRDKEIKKLEKQFGHKLTDKEIENIMSYKDMVVSWKREIEMNKKWYKLK